MRVLHALAATALHLLSTAQSDGLPHLLAPGERDLIPAYRDSRAGMRGIEEPPAFPVRTMAEWEEVQALTISWAGYSSILKQITHHARMECEVIILCEDPAEVSAYLLEDNNGGPAFTGLEGITLLEAPTNSVWIRDYGAETIYRNDVDSLMLLDWIYNRPRPDDDGSPDLVAVHLGIPIFSTTQAPYDLVHTGGNFMCDGAGTAFSSELVLDENGPAGEFNQTVKDVDGVSAIMEQWMGIHRYITMPTLPFDAIHHIDMHMKLLDEETLLVGEFPAGESDGPQIESNITAVTGGSQSMFGSPWQLVRIPMPPSGSGNFPPDASYRTYANNVFVNGTVLVPTYRTEYDTTGLRILQEALPGYNVVGIDCDDMGANIIQASGAIHCITKGIGVEDPLLIQHQPLGDQAGGSGDYPINATIKHRSGIGTATVYWTTDTAAGFEQVAMSAGGDDAWAAEIPEQPGGSTVYYYIHSQAASGKEQVRPIVAPEGWWRFHVSGGATVGAAEAPLLAEVFPNPAQELLYVRIDGRFDGPVLLRLIDASGRTVRILHDGRLPVDHRLFFDVSRILPGPYALEATTASGRAVSRFVKY